MCASTILQSVCVGVHGPEKSVATVAAVLDFYKGAGNPVESIIQGLRAPGEQVSTLWAPVCVRIVADSKAGISRGHTTTL